MPEPITAEQSEELIEKLQFLRQELKHLLDDSMEASKPVDLREPIGRISRMDAIADQSMAKANKENLVIKARQVDASLADFEQGRYGFCRKCHQPVGYERLSARPETPFCIACQTDIEGRKQNT